MKKLKEQFIAVRATAIFLEQLLALVNRLGENKSRVIMRAVSEAHEKYCRTKR